MSYRAQDEWAKAHGLRPSTAARCPRVVAGLYCLDGNPNSHSWTTCICRTRPTYNILDHQRMWLDVDGNHVLTAEPYRTSDIDLDAFTTAMAALDLKVDVSDESTWYPGSTILVTLRRASPKAKMPRKSDTPVIASVPTMRRELDALLVRDFGARRQSTWHGTQIWRVTSPAGGYFTVSIALRRRWCRVAIERTETTVRVPDVAEAWFEEHLCPHVAKSGFLMYSRDYAEVKDLERSKLLEVLPAWITQERAWGAPCDGGMNS